MTQKAKRLICLEDDPDTRKLMYVALSRHGFDVETAHNGIEALRMYLSAAAEHKPFDALILDCATAPLDGFTVAQVVRMVERNWRSLPKAKIGFYTAFTETVESSTLLTSVEADRYFRKPDHAAELPDLVAKWLEESE